MGVAAELAQGLANNSTAFCKEYLSAGARNGSYWVVGDANNTPGGSLFVLLTRKGNKQPGRWMDAGQAGVKGDLLEILKIQKGSYSEAVKEAARFLGGSGTMTPVQDKKDEASFDSALSAQKMVNRAVGIRGTHAERYLNGRGLYDLPYEDKTLRYMGACFYQQGGTVRQKDQKNISYPTLICPVTDLGGKVTGVLRTYLDKRNPVKADVRDVRGDPEAKKMLGNIEGNAVRFGPVTGNAVAGEGIETVLSVRQALPKWHHLAGLSAAHLSAMKFDDRVKRLWVAHDNDEEGYRSLAILTERGAAQGIDVRPLAPIDKDHNQDLTDMIAAHGVDRGREIFASRLRGIVLAIMHSAS